MVHLDPIATRIVGKDDQGNNILHIEGTCLHDDDKPTTNIDQGSWLLELDSKEVKFFDGSSNTWR